MTIQLLKELCVSHGVAALVIIHQPDGYVFECFNRLLLVSGGKCVFSDHLSNLGSLYDEHFGVAQKALWGATGTITKTG